MMIIMIINNSSGECQSDGSRLGLAGSTAELVRRCRRWPASSARRIGAGSRRTAFFLFIICAFKISES